MSVRLPLMIAVVLVAAAVGLWVTLPAPRPSPFAGAWQSYVAHQYMQQAMEAVQQFPRDRRKAVTAMSRALELASSDATIRAAAPSVFLAAGAYDMALKSTINEPNPDPLLVGQCLLKLGRTEDGTRLILQAGRAVNAVPGTGPDAQRQRALALNNVGYVLADAGVALTEAREMLERATIELPLDPNCVDSLGWLYYRINDTRSALFYLERAARLQPAPGEPEILFHLAVVYNCVGKFQRARRLLDRVLVLDPQHEEARRELDNARWLLPRPTMVGAPPAAATG
jgi:tetratricopeptide (TPR) repeat protein